MSIFTNMFNVPTPATPAPGTAPTPSTPTPNPGKLADVVPSIEPVSTKGTAPNGSVPDNVDKSESPLDEFTSLWDTDPKAPSPAGDFVPEQLDTAKLQELVNKVDMRSVITPETLEAINSGGEGANEAFLTAMNAMNQKTLMQATLVANKMIEQNIIQANKATNAKLPALLKEQTLKNSIKDKNPAYSHPAVAPVMAALTSTLALKYPDSSPSELTKMTQGFVDAMSQQLAPPVPKAEPSSTEVDWEKFLED